MGNMSILVEKLEKIISALFIFIALAFTTFAYDFANYPSPILVDGKFDGIMVVGDKASAEEVIAGSDIAVSLSYTVLDQNGEEKLYDTSSIIDTMRSGDTKTYTIENLDYETTLNYVDLNDASFIINGMETGALRKGETYTLSGGKIIGLVETYIQNELSSATFFLSNQKLKVQASDLSVEDVKLASEVDNIHSVNSILIGHACNNPLIMELRSQGENCKSNYEPNTGYIEAYDTPNGKVSIVVTGHSIKDISNAARVLSYYGDFRDVLKGNKLKVKDKNGNLEVTPYQFNNDPQISQSADYNELYLKIGLSALVLLVLLFVFIIPKVTGNKKIR
ncbi:hypothetical protein HYW19_02060 [Candidatus Woesearchaeota archaeon]|nr:hypothetical protein [Candidatus Woesearchaeota archaeon]